MASSNPPSAAVARLHPVLSSFEPEAVAGLALVALELLDAITRRKLVAADWDEETVALLDRSFAMEDAARGPSSLLPAALAAVLSTAEGDSHV